MLKGAQTQKLGASRRSAVAVPGKCNKLETAWEREQSEHSP